ncbi:response regulator transcription factor [bacterium]|nr:response regulator transcription factor [bacterium]MCI0605172.1 response regulator transcription factor [bacterium]
MTSRQIRIMVVDDHPVVRAGLVMLISHETDMTVVAEASHGKEALSLFEKTNPDVTLIDLSLPDIHGVEVIERIRKSFPQAKLLVLSVYSGSEDVFRSLQSGALGYLIKDSTPDQLFYAIREAYEGRRYLHPSAASNLADRMLNDMLTPRELDVVRLMVQGKSNKEIATDLNLSETTVKTHVANILMKLNVSSRSQAILEALKRGIVHQG